MKRRWWALIMGFLNVQGKRSRPNSGGNFSSLIINKYSRIRPMLVLIAWTRRKRRQQGRAPILEHILSCSWFFSNPHVAVAMVKMAFEWLVWFNCIHSFTNDAKYARFYIESSCPLQSQLFAWSCGIRNSRIWVFMTLFTSLWEHMIVKSANNLAWGQRFFY